MTTANAINVPQSDVDATAEFYAALNDNSRWIIKDGVPVFKCHNRIDPNTGKQINVDIAKLHRIAANMNRLEKEHGVPIRISLGHTEPRKSEREQPPIAGYYRNHRVATFGPKNEPAIIATELLDPQYRSVRKNYPYRSSEYYDDNEQITGVALLTRDPYLDLGVVAYSKSGPEAVHYSRLGNTSANGYFFLLGDETMNPNMGIPGNQPVVGLPQIQPNPPQMQPQYPSQVPQYPAPSPQYPAQPVPQHQYVPQYQTAQVPTPYAGSWPGPVHTPNRNIGHSHPSGGAIYGGASAARYAEGMPPGGPPEMGGGMPPPGGPEGGGGVGLEEVYDLLAEALEAMKACMTSGEAGAGGMEAPQQPFPPGGGGGGPPQMMSRRTAQQSGRPVSYAPPQRPMQRPQQQRPMGQQRPQQYQYSRQQQDNDMRTITGRPVGYQLENNALRYEMAQMQNTVQVLMYEREQADTQWCLSEISRLQGVGYNVGQYEFDELKKKAPQEREVYLNNITTNYSKVPTDMPPPLLGEQTPGVMIDPSTIPLSREQMDQVLTMTKGSTDPALYNQAINYIRGGGQPAMYNRIDNRIAQQNQVQQHQWNPGESAPSVLQNPYGEPSMNGSI